MGKKAYYTLSFTWGLPLTLIGLIVGLVLMVFGFKPKKWLHGYYFEVNEKFAGLNLGVVFLCSNNCSTYVKNHEFGHGLQNCKYGLFTIFIVHLPSIVRHWYRRIRIKKGLENKTNYYDIRFEKQASDWGTKAYEIYNEERG